MTLNAQFIFNAAMGGLGRENVFLDIGHGIGNVVIQGAFTRGCRSRGIEYVEERNTLASIYKWGFNDISEFHVTEGIVRSLMYFLRSIQHHWFCLSLTVVLVPSQREISNLEISNCVKGT